MTTLGVALTWIAISIAGAKGLVVFSRAAATIDSEELATFAAEGESKHGGHRSQLPECPPSLLS
jgi:hypothetical protein